MPHVGLLFLGSPERTQGGDEFRDGMRSVGPIEGGNILFEYRVRGKSGEATTEFRGLRCSVVRPQRAPSAMRVRDMQ